jgi:DNA-binding CsgD family transcriptional regulator
MLQTLDRLAAAVILVDGEARIVFVNAAARNMLDGGLILRNARGRLRAVDARADRLLREAFAAAAGGDAAIGVRGIDAHVAGSNGDRWLANVLPLTSGARERTGVSHAAVAALFLRRAEIDTPSSMQVMADLYRLTPAEIRVLHGVAAIGGVPAVADALGISEATVKSHLQSLFDKTGSRRQADLVKLLAAHASPFVN